MTNNVMVWQYNVESWTYAEARLISLHLYKKVSPYECIYIENSFHEVIFIFHI